MTIHDLVPIWHIILWALIAALLSVIAVFIPLSRKLSASREEAAKLSVTLDAERRSHEEKLAAIEQARQSLSETFTALASQALQSNNESFLRLAQENLKQLHIQAQNELQNREKSIEHLMQPIKTALEKAEQEIRKIEVERKEAYGALHKHLETMAVTQQQLHTETRNLVQALRRPEVRGRWGEMTLRRLVELAGMVEHCDFVEQSHQKSTEGDVVRPDMIVHMPAGRDIVVDVKTPLDAYISAMEAESAEQRKQFLVNHGKTLRERVKELATKAYWRQFKQSPDFVILFIPGEQFLTAALDVDPNLMDYALTQKIILATPTTFVAVLRAVAFGWRQEQLTENAEHIRDVGEQLYNRLSIFSEHLSKMGKSLSQTVSQFNKSVGAFERSVLPGARKFTDLGITKDRLIQPPENVEPLIRSVTQDKEQQ